MTTGLNPNGLADKTPRRRPNGGVRQDGPKNEIQRQAEVRSQTILDVWAHPASGAHGQAPHPARQAGLANAPRHRPLMQGGTPQTPRGSRVSTASPQVTPAAGVPSQAARTLERPVNDSGTITGIVSQSSVIRCHLLPLRSLDGVDKTGQKARNSATRSVAQPGSAPASGAGGRQFESAHSDQQEQGPGAMTPAPVSFRAVPDVIPAACRSNAEAPRR